MAQWEDVPQNNFFQRRVKGRLRMRLAIARQRLRRQKGGDASHVGVEQLRASPLLAAWSAPQLSKLRQQMVCEVYQVGEAIIYGNEPSRASSIYWLVSGRLAEVLDKGEKIPKAKRTVVSEEPFGSSAVATAYSISSLLGTLEKFRFGRLVAAEVLFLGACYRRTIRCRTEVRVLRVRYSAVRLIMKERSFPFTTVTTTISAAKEIIQNQMEWSSEKPSIDSLARVNPVLSELDRATLNMLWFTLSPIVMCASEVITPNVLSSDTIYFLYTGCVKISSKESKYKKTISLRGAAFGLNNFACVDAPNIFNEVQEAVAVSFSQLWSFSTSKLQEVVSEEEIRRCLECAKQSLRFRPNRQMIYAALRKAFVLSKLPESVLVLITNRMEVSVVGIGDCLLAPAKVPQKAFIVLTGETIFRKNICRICNNNSDNGTIVDETVPIPCGDPIAFNECIAQKLLGDGVFAVTSAIVLIIARDSIMEAMHESDEVPYINRLCQTAAVHVNASNILRCAHALAVNKPQRPNINRVQGTEDERRGVTWSAPSQLCDSGVSARRAELSNRVLSSLTVQLRAGPSSLTDHWRKDLLRGVAKGYVEHDTQPNDMHDDAYRSSACFTLDENGCIRFCENDKELHTEPPCNVDPTPLENVSHTPPSPRPAPRRPRGPKLSALRCAPREAAGRRLHVTVTELSQQVREMRCEAKKLQDEADYVLARPFNH